MKPKLFDIDKNLSPYVEGIYTFENQLADKQTLLPFYADGYPGIIFQQAPNGVVLKPKNKLLSEFFLYGQTIDPIELSIEGPFRLIVFQLYPFSGYAAAFVNKEGLVTQTH